MDKDNNPINSNWNVGTSANGGNKNGLEEQSEQQPPDEKKSRMDDPSSKEELVKIAIINDGGTSDKQIRELEISTMDKKGELNELELKMIALKDEFAQNIAALEEKHQKEIAQLKLEERIQMNEQKIDQTKHEMKVQLATEVWHDSLALVPRRQLGNVVSEIGDRQFADIIQPFLHEVRKITLGEMRIIAPRPYVPSDQPMVHVWPNAATNMPDWPMQENIKDFKGIDLNYVDTSILNFLEKFQENSLLADVNIYIDYNEVEDEDEDLSRLEENILEALIKIAPFITSIDSITFPEIDLFEMVYYNDDEDEVSKSQLLLKEMMAKTRIVVTDCSIYLSDEFESRENQRDWCSNWLYTPRNDVKPRMLKSNYHIYQTHCATVIESIKKNFEMANNPVSFIIYIRLNYFVFEDISKKNVKTNEKLVIKKIDDDKMLISRYPLNAAKSWIEAYEREIIEWDYKKLNRIINIDGELTIAK